ncbi:hypothetical protein VTO42DRAFT_418 [Malbranchea cinnamomea]
MVSRTIPRLAGLVNRQNRVPYFQRLYQKDDGVRLWRKGPKSKYMLYPYYVSLVGGLVAAVYGTIRTVFGKKTWI